MKYKKNKKLEEIKINEKYKNYNITKIESDPINIKLFKQYYGDINFCIEEFESKYGKLGKNHEIYYRVKEKLVYFVDNIVEKIFLREL